MRTHRLDPKNLVILILLGLFLWLAADGRVQGRDGGGGGGDAARNLIAVTGTYGSGASALYLIDAKTRHMAIYRLENGRQLEFVAARDCQYDFFIETYNDQSPRGLLPARLRSRWQNLSKRGGDVLDPSGLPKPEGAGAVPEQAPLEKGPERGPRLLPVGGKVK